MPRKKKKSKDADLGIPSIMEADLNYKRELEEAMVREVEEKAPEAKKKKKKLSRKNLLQKTKPELLTMIMDRHLSKSGNKSNLVQNILDFEKIKKVSPKLVEEFAPLSISELVEKCKENKVNASGKRLDLLRKLVNNLKKKEEMQNPDHSTKPKRKYKKKKKDIAPILTESRRKNSRRAKKKETIPEVSIIESAEEEEQLIVRKIVSTTLRKMVKQIAEENGEFDHRSDLSSQDVECSVLKYNIESSSFILKPKWVSHAKNPILSIHFQHPNDTRFATGGADGLVKIWSSEPLKSLQAEQNPATSKLLSVLRSHYPSQVNCVRFSPDGEHLATCSADSAIYVWRRNANESPNGFPENWEAGHALSGHKSDVQDLAWSPNLKWFASCSVDNTICIWSVGSRSGGDLTFTKFAVLKHHVTWVQGISFDPSSTLLLSQSFDGEAVIWMLSEGEVWKRVYNKRYSIPDENREFLNPQAADGDSSSTKETYDQSSIDSNKQAKISAFLRNSFSPNGGCAIIPNGYQESNSIFLSNIIDRMLDTNYTTWGTSQLIIAHRKPTTVVEFSPTMFKKVIDEQDGVERFSAVCILAIGSKDHSLTIWATSQSSPILQFEYLFNETITDIHWGNDGKSLLACSYDGTVCYLSFEKTDLCDLPYLSSSDLLLEFSKYYQSSSIEHIINAADHDELKFQEPLLEETPLLVVKKKKKKDAVTKKYSVGTKRKDPPSLLVNRTELKKPIVPADISEFKISDLSESFQSFLKSLITKQYLLEAKVPREFLLVPSELHSPITNIDSSPFQKPSTNSNTNTLQLHVVSSETSTIRLYQSKELLWSRDFDSYLSDVAFSKDFVIVALANGSLIVLKTFSNRLVESNNHLIGKYITQIAINSNYFAVATHDCYIYLFEINDLIQKRLLSGNFFWNSSNDQSGLVCVLKTEIEPSASLNISLSSSESIFSKPAKYPLIVAQIDKISWVYVPTSSMWKRIKADTVSEVKVFDKIVDLAFKLNSSNPIGAIAKGQDMESVSEPSLDSSIQDALRSLQDCKSEEEFVSSCEKYIEVLLESGVDVTGLKALVSEFLNCFLVSDLEGNDRIPPHSLKKKVVKTVLDRLRSIPELEDAMVSWDQVASVLFQP